MKQAKLVGLLVLLVGCASVFSGCPPETIVVFADTGLENAIRAELGLPFGFLTQANLLELRELDARALAIRDLSGIEYCTNLTSLDLDANEISDITPLTAMVQGVVLRYTIGSTATVSCGGMSVYLRNSSTLSTVGGIIGSPSVQFIFKKNLLISSIVPENTVFSGFGIDFLANAATSACSIGLVNDSIIAGTSIFIVFSISCSLV